MVKYTMANSLYKIVSTYSVKEFLELDNLPEHSMYMKQRIFNLISLGNECVCCKLQANKILVVKELPFDIYRPHNNSLYHIFKLVNYESMEFFTFDHIIPKMCGGPDILENFQLMCYTCNFKRGQFYDRRLILNRRSSKKPKAKAS